jgi:hypothetical protein
MRYSRIYCNGISKLITIFCNVNFSFWQEGFEEVVSLLFFRIEESYEEGCCTEGGAHGFIRILIPNGTVSRLRSLFNNRPTNSNTYVFCPDIGNSNNNNNNNNNNNFILLNISIETPVLRAKYRHVISYPINSVIYRLATN